MHCLSRFQGRPRRIIFPIFAGAVKRLLAYRVPDHPPCGGVTGRCAVCVAFLNGLRNCLAGATATLICFRGAASEVAELRICGLWQRFDERAGYIRFRSGAAVNVKIRKNDQFRRATSLDSEFRATQSITSSTSCWPFGERLESLSVPRAPSSSTPSDGAAVPPCSRYRDRKSVV